MPLLYVGEGKKGYTPGWREAKGAIRKNHGFYSQRNAVSFRFENDAGANISVVQGLGEVPH